MRSLLLPFLALSACAQAPRSGARPVDGTRPPGVSTGAEACSGAPRLPLPSHTVCPDGETTPGIDVSYWQGDVDWERVAQDGVTFAVIRVSHGLDIYDSKYTYNWREARAHGILRGTYQYFIATDDATEQARLLLDEMGPLEDDDLPPVLDLETGDNEGVSVRTITEGVREWVDVVEAGTGRTPLVYTNVSSWSSMTGDMDPGDLPLWVANWNVTCPLVPDAWADWVFWQHSATGSVAGIGTDVDLDVFNGNLADLRRWIEASAGGEPEETGETGGSVDPGDTGDPDTGPCACEDGDQDVQDCSDGGLRSRTCDACAWGDWSPCIGGMDEMAGCACAASDRRRPSAATAALAFLALLAARGRRTRPRK